MAVQICSSRFSPAFAGMALKWGSSGHLQNTLSGKGMNLMRMINWPVVIKFDGDDELIYVGSEEEWQHDAASLCYNHQGDDCLVDSSGHIFRLGHLHDDSINTEDTGRQITLQDFIRLVRIHASSAHHCCIEKISFRTIADGIELVAGMDN